MKEPEVKAGQNGKCNSFKAIHFSSELKKKCETMIRVFKHRKVQTYEQIKLAKNRLFLFTWFNRLSPNSDNINLLLTHNIHTMSRD